MRNNIPFFSIIVPVYNIEKYISHCVNSILAQSFDNYEVILIDDGSSDNSFWLCDEFAELDNRICVIHQENKGLSEARNAGIKKAIGEYIIFLDGDDWIDNHDTLLCLKNEIEKAERPQVFICLYSKCEDGSNIVKACSYSFENNNKTPLQIFKQLLALPGIFLGAQVFVLNSQYLREKKLFFEKGIYHEDNLWIAQVFMRSSHVQLVNIEIFCYRQGRESSIMSSTSHKKLMDQMYIIDILKNEALRKSTDEQKIIFYWLTKIYKVVIIKAIKGKIKLDSELIEKLKENKYLLNYGEARDKVIQIFLPLWLNSKQKKTRLRDG